MITLGFGRLQTKASRQARWGWVPAWINAERASTAEAL